MSYQSRGGSSVDEQKEILPPSVMKCFDRAKPRVVQQGPTPWPGVTKRKEGPVGGRAFWIARGGNTPRCVGEWNVCDLPVPVKDQKRISKCRRTGATTPSYALLHVLQGWPRMQEVFV